MPNVPRAVTVSVRYLGPQPRRACACTLHYTRPTVCALVRSTPEDALPHDCSSCQSRDRHRRRDLSTHLDLR